MVDSEDFIRRNGRKLYPFNCSSCGKKEYRRLDHIKKFINSYCSPECKTAGQKTSIPTPCKNCGKIVERIPSQLNRTAASYCGSSCAASLNNKKHKRGNLHHNYTDGSSSYRVRALRTYAHKCHNPNCLLTPQLETIPVEMLDVDHIDNDRTNNDITNLIVLCVWCHSLKTRDIEITDHRDDD